MLIVHTVKEVRAHRPVRVVPVPEADSVVAGITAEVDDDAHKYEPNEGNDFDAAKPELEFTENAHTKKVH